MKKILKMIDEVFERIDIFIEKGGKYIRVFVYLFPVLASFGFFGNFIGSRPKRSDIGKLDFESAISKYIEEFRSFEQRIESDRRLYEQSFEEQYRSDKERLFESNRLLEERFGELSKSIDSVREGLYSIQDSSGRISEQAKEGERITRERNKWFEERFILGED